MCYNCSLVNDDEDEICRGCGGNYKLQSEVLDDDELDDQKEQDDEETKDQAESLSQEINGDIKLPQEDQYPKKKTVIVIVPFGVPASGKTTVWEMLKEHLESLPGWSCDSVSSD